MEVEERSPLASNLQPLTSNTPTARARGPFQIAVFPGDGIGPEVTAEAVRVLERVGQVFGHRFDFCYDVVGGAAIDRFGAALRPETIALARRCRAILFGAVGGPQWDDPKAPVRPEDAILGLRKSLGLFANLRPVKPIPALSGLSPVREEIVAGVDLLFVRETTSGVYFGRPKKRWEAGSQKKAVDTCRYTQREIERVVHLAYQQASQRRRKLTLVDKANVMATSRLWREVTYSIAPSYHWVDLEVILVDAAAMHLLRRPRDFDVVVTENLFGDILTDEASMLAGSLGLAPSATLRGDSFGLYEPVHGSAPDIAGKGLANPVGAILSAALLLRHSLKLEREGQAIEAAVQVALERGLRTADLGPAGPAATTVEMADAVLAAIRT